MNDTLELTVELTEKKHKDNSKNMCIQFSDVETTRYRDFCKEHISCVTGNFGAIGGGIEITAVGTGLGWILSCKCQGCGKTKDITDIDSW